MMKRSILFFLFVLLSVKSFSQLGSGYMGKRFQLGYGLHFSPAILGSNGSEASILGRGNAVGGDLAFNSMHQGFMEFSFKNRTSIGFSAKYYKSTFDNSVYASTNISSNGYLYNVTDRPSGFYTIKGLNYSLYFKFYHRRYVAPWGRYFILGPTINTYKCFYDPSSMRMSTTDYYSGNAPVYVADFGPQGQQFMRPDLLFGWGRTRIVANRITIDYGINFEAIALLLTLWDTTSEEANIFETTEITNFNYFERTSKRRVREVGRLNVFLKVGVLLF
jgi:hypothetical protein